MKKSIYALIVLMVVVSGLVFASQEINNGTDEKASPKPLTAAEKKAEVKKWEDTPGGIQYKKWEASAQGKKVLGDAGKIMKQVTAFDNMEAVITSLSLPPGSRLGFGMMARINGNDYILSFGLEEKHEFQQLRSLKVNDKIIIKSHGVSHAPKYEYPIVRGDYIEQNNKMIYKRPPFKGGC